MSVQKVGLVLVGLRDSDRRVAGCYSLGVAGAAIFGSYGRDGVVLPSRDDCFRYGTAGGGRGVLAWECAGRQRHIFFGLKLPFC